MRLVSQQHIVPQQLSLDLGEAELKQRLGETAIDQTGIERSVVFQKISRSMVWLIFSGGYRNFSLPLNIQIDFRVTRHDRLKCGGHFHKRPCITSQDGAKANYCYRLKRMTFETLVLSFAGTH